MKLKVNEQYIVKKAGLHYVNSFDVGYYRQRKRKTFFYSTEQDKVITCQRILARISKLTIPPAWQDVWICKKRNGHIQVTGFDARQRKQYIYHQEWQVATAMLKFEKLIEFASLLPKLRGHVKQDLKQKKLTKQKVVATVVSLIDKAHIRVGNRTYELANGSKGAVTLTSDEVEVNNFKITLDFIGKSGVHQHIDFVSAKVAKVINTCQELDSQYLFSYPAKSDRYRPVTSTDVNSYLLKCTDEAITAKYFRTWWANVLLLEALEKQYNKEPNITKKQFTECIKAAAKQLGHTPTICRNSYIHPAFITGLETGQLENWLAEVSNKKFNAKLDMSIAELKFLYLLKRKLIKFSN